MDDKLERDRKTSRLYGSDVRPSWLLLTGYKAVVVDEGGVGGRKRRERERERERGGTTLPDELEGSPPYTLCTVSRLSILERRP